MRHPSLICLRCRSGSESGAAAVELAVIVLPVIVLALGTFDYFAASYEITSLEGAARAIGEYVRNAPACYGNPNSTGCTNGVSTFFGTMQTNNSSLSAASWVNPPTIYYTCSDNQVVSSTGDCSNSPYCGSGCPDTRLFEYVSVTVQTGWWKLFSWDPWSSSTKLTARMSTRIQ